MYTNTQPDLHEQGFSKKSLLNDWRGVIVHKPETLAGRYIISRFPVPPGHADLIAYFAGLGADR
jgi:hypothetical protein